MGTPICVDSVTSKPALQRTFGHFARVLVDLDMSKELKYEVLVERTGYAFFVELAYEKIPEFCDHCKMVGHNVAECRKVKKPVVDNKNKEKDVEKKSSDDNVDGGKNLRKMSHNDQWVQRDAHVVDLEETSNRFAALNNDVDNSPQHRENISNSPINNTAPTGNIDIRGSDDEAIPEESVDVSEEEGSSQASEFVDDTQRMEYESNAASQATPERIHQDMQFLNHAWANLADVDEEQIRIQQQAFNDATTADLEADIDKQIQQKVQANTVDSGFKLVIRKSPKKKIYAASKASSSYLTRSKVPTSHSK